MHTYLPTYIHAYICAYMRAYIHAYIYAYMRTFCRHSTTKEPNCGDSQIYPMCFFWCSAETLLLVCDAIGGRSARCWFGFCAAHVLIADHVLCAGGGAGCRCSPPMVHILHDMIVWLVCLFKSKHKHCNCEVQERLQASYCSASLLNLFVFSSLCQR